LSYADLVMKHAVGSRVGGLCCGMQLDFAAFTNCWSRSNRSLEYCDELPYRECGIDGMYVGKYISC